MAVWKTERSFAGKTPQEIHQATRKVIDGLADRYSLKHESDERSLTGKVSRTGVNGSYQVIGEKVSISMDFNFLIPGAIRTKVQDEVNRQLDKLFG